MSGSGPEDDHQVLQLPIVCGPTQQPAVELPVDVEDVLVVVLVPVDQPAVQHLPGGGVGPHPVPLLLSCRTSGAQHYFLAALSTDHLIPHSIL